MRTLLEDVEAAQRLKKELAEAKSPLECAIRYQNFIQDELLRTNAPVLDNPVEDDTDADGTAELRAAG